MILDACRMSRRKVVRRRSKRFVNKGNSVYCGHILGEDKSLKEGEL